MAAEFLAAVKRGDRAAVDRMLEADPSLASARDEHGTSAVLLAHYHGKTDVAAALGRHLDVHDASITRVIAPPDQSDALHLRGEPADRRRAHLLGRGEFTQRLGSAHEDRKRGQLCRRRAGQHVAAPRAPQEVYRRGVQAVGELPLTNSRRRPGCLPGHAVILVSKAK